MNIRPMLSATIESLDCLVFPLLVSTKLDGIRAIVNEGVLTSRNGKAIPNHFLQKEFGNSKFNYADGELIIGSPTSPSCFRDTTSAVMSHSGEPKVTYYLFDWVHEALDFTERLVIAANIATKHPMMSILPHTVVSTPEEITSLEEKALARGFEGLMLRDPHGMYKFGRSTMREQGLMKLKRFKDAEAIVIGVEERLHNGNEAILDSLGYTERSSHKGNMTGRGDLGALLVKDLETGIEFSIGTGFDDALRAKLWVIRPMGRIVKYKYFPSGSKDKPRFPVFMGFRHPSDL